MEHGTFGLSLIIFNVFYVIQEKSVLTKLRTFKEPYRKRDNPEIEEKRIKDAKRRDVRDC